MRFYVAPLSQDALLQSPGSRISLARKGKADAIAELSALNEDLATRLEEVNRLTPRISSNDGAPLDDTASRWPQRIRSQPTHT